MKNILGFFAFTFLFALSALGENIKVLHVGNSLTAGDFGASMNAFYASSYGKENVVVIGSCGASPESYLKSYRTYSTRCGYRAHTPEGTLIRDFVNGHAPKATPTPKLETLLSKYNPKFVVVELGTNWMDGFSESRDSKIIEQFVSIVGQSGAKLIWITPPDSSHYSRSVQTGVKSVIMNSARKHKFQTIDSSLLTHYTRASGGDGIHYNTKQAKEWAAKVIAQIKTKLN